MSPELSRTLNALGLLGLSAILAVAFFDQLVFGELPCPLCLLQRVGFVAAGIGLALNVKFGPRPSHYAMVILAALVGGSISVRQTLLHITPGTGTFGAALLGMHFYVWAVVIFTLIILGSAVMLMFDKQFEDRRVPLSALSALAIASLVIASILALSNGVSTVLECAGGLCPDEPTSYMLLQDGALKGLLGK